MPWKTVVYDRQELYKEVWRRPLQQIAEDQGISDER